MSNREKNPNGPKKKEKKSELGILIKTLLRERSLSMRRLGAIAGIDASTISRITNGKQRPKPEHLKKIAKCLEIPTEVLFEAAGFLEVQPSKVKSTQNFYKSLNTIQEILKMSNFLNPPLNVEHIEQQLAKYEQYVQTEEGKRIILEEFHKKVEQVGGVGPFIEDLKGMYDQFIQISESTSEYAILGSALLYFILSTDIIPDYLFPVGYLDDAIAIQMILNRLQKLKP